MAVIKVFKDEAGEYRWNKESGGNIVADSGEGYTEKERAVEMANKEAGPDDTIEVADESADG
jgi:uncharacterized protein YegP (UPF0339 family)